MFPQTPTVFLLAQTLALTTAIPSLPLSPRAPNCHLESPYSTWNIFQEPARRGERDQTGPSCAQAPPYCSEMHNDITLSQGANATNQHDLVASYQNMAGERDPTCAEPFHIQGPYALEFEFDPKDVFTSTGSNKRIDVFDITGDLPEKFDGHREYYANPTWDNIAPLTGAKVGSFKIPKEAKGKVVSVVKGVQETCRQQFNWRLSFTDADAGAGSVLYKQVNTTGLRLRLGC